MSPECIHKNAHIIFMMCDLHTKCRILMRREIKSNHGHTHTQHQTVFNTNCANCTNILHIYYTSIQTYNKLIQWEWEGNSWLFPKVIHHSSTFPTPDARIYSNVRIFCTRFFREIANFVDDIPLVNVLFMLYERCWCVNNNTRRRMARIVGGFKTLFKPFIVRKINVGVCVVFAMYYAIYLWTCLPRKNCTES